MTYISDPRARSLHRVSPSTQGYCCQYTPRSYGSPANHKEDRWSGWQKLTDTYFSLFNLHVS